MESGVGAIEGDDEGEPLFASWRRPSDKSAAGLSRRANEDEPSSLVVSDYQSFYRRAIL